MIELGKKSEIFGAESLRPLQTYRDILVDSKGRPTQMPRLREKEDVIAGYDQGLGERMFVCESIEDMQQLWDAYARGGALTLNWYAGEDPGFITIIPPKQGDTK